MRKLKRFRLPTDGHTHDHDTHHPHKDNKPHDVEKEGVRVGIVIDGKVVDIIYTSFTLGAMLLAKPTLVDLSGKADIVVGSEVPTE
jgi:hypothetical protein